MIGSFQRNVRFGSATSKRPGEAHARRQDRVRGERVGVVDRGRRLAHALLHAPFGNRQFVREKLGRGIEIFAPRHAAENPLAIREVVVHSGVILILIECPRARIKKVIEVGDGTGHRLQPGTYL